jgi:ABC-type amino acid transport system permease subunit
MESVPDHPANPTVATSRLVIGFLVSPGAPALLVYLFYLCFLPSGEASTMGLIYFFFAYIAAIVMGYPFYRYARKHSLTTPRQFALLGAAAGGIAYLSIVGLWALLVALSSPFEAIMIFANTALIGIGAASYAAAAAAVFWTIVVRPRTPRVHSVAG